MEAVWLTKEIGWKRNYEGQKCKAHTLSFQYVHGCFKTLRTALSYTLRGSSAPGSTSLETWERLSTVSRVTSLNSRSRHILTLALLSLSTQTLWVGTLFSAVISGHPALMFHLVIDFYNKVLSFHQPSRCEEEELHLSSRSLQVPHPS